MGSTRDQLYEKVWARPTPAVAKDYEVFASYLARVCASLSVADASDTGSRSRRVAMCAHDMREALIAQRS